MLQCENRSGYQHCHLLVVGNSLECRSHCYLSLSETHIPAHQTVHRPAAFHILLHCLHRLDLIRCLLILERRLKLLLQKTVGTESKTFCHPSLGIKPDKILGDILDL